MGVKLNDISNAFNGCSSLANLNVDCVVADGCNVENFITNTNTTITFKQNTNRDSIQEILQGCPWQIEEIYDGITTTTETYTGTAETDISVNIMEAESKTLELQGNTLQNLIANPNNEEETSEFIYSGNLQEHILNGSEVSKITIEGYTYQDENDLFIQSSAGNPIIRNLFKEEYLALTPTIGEIDGKDWYVINGAIDDSLDASSHPLAITSFPFEENVQYKVVVRVSTATWCNIVVKYIDGTDETQVDKISDIYTVYTNSNKTVSNIRFTTGGVTYIKDIRLYQVGVYDIPPDDYYLPNQNEYEFDIIVSNGDNTETQTKRLYLPCQLHGHPQLETVIDGYVKPNILKDKLYYDKDKGKWVIEKNYNIELLPRAYSISYNNTDNESYCNINYINNSFITPPKLGAYYKTCVVEGTLPINYMYTPASTDRYNYSCIFSSFIQIKMKTSQFTDSTPTLEEAQTLLNGKYVLYQINPIIIETEYTDPNMFKFDTYVGDTHISSNSEIKPYINIESNGIVRDCLIKGNITYTVDFNIDKVATLNLGGKAVQVLPTETQKIITTPNTLAHNQLIITGTNVTANNLKVIEGDYSSKNKIDYFEGIESVGVWDDDKNAYKLEVISKNVPNIVEGEQYYETIKTFYLPCQLNKIGDITDKLYWDETKGYYCIEKNISVIDGVIEIKESPEIIDLADYDANFGKLRLYGENTNIYTNGIAKPSVITFDHIEA